MKSQKEYYEALGEADRIADSAGFVELMLEIIRGSLKELSDDRNSSDQVSDQVDRLLSAMGNDTLSAAELMNRLELSHRPSFRKNYLNPALEAHLIERTIPDKPSSSRQKYRKARKKAADSVLQKIGEDQNKSSPLI